MLSESVWRRNGLSLCLIILVQISSASSSNLETGREKFREMLAISGQLTHTQSVMLSDCLKKSTNHNVINVKQLSACIRSSVPPAGSGSGGEQLSCPTCKRSAAGFTDLTNLMGQGSNPNEAWDDQGKMMLLKQDLDDSTAKWASWQDGNKSWVIGVVDKNNSSHTSPGSEVGAGDERQVGKRGGQRWLIEAIEETDQKEGTGDERMTDEDINNDWSERVDGVNDDELLERFNGVKSGGRLLGLANPGVMKRLAGDKERMMKSSAIGSRDSESGGGMDPGSAHRLMWVGRRMRRASSAVQGHHDSSMSTTKTKINKESKNLLRHST